MHHRRGPDHTSPSSLSAWSLWPGPAAPPPKSDAAASPVHLLTQLHDGFISVAHSMPFDMAVAGRPLVFQDSLGSYAAIWRSEVKALSGSEPGPRLLCGSVIRLESDVKQHGMLLVRAFDGVLVWAP